MKPENKNAIPTNQGLQQHSTGINKKYDAGFSVDFDTMHEVHQNHTKSPPLFGTLVLADDSWGRDPATKAAIPSDHAVEEGRKWVNENRL